MRKFLIFKEIKLFLLYILYIYKIIKYIIKIKKKNINLKLSL